METIISKAVDNEKGSCLSSCSEFHEERFTKPLLDLHEDREKKNSIIKHGASYPFLPDIENS